MGFHDVRLNGSGGAIEVNFGTRGGPDFSVAVIENDAGQEERIARWTDPKREYEADFSGRKQFAIYEALQFFIARQGATHSFRFKEYSDYATTSNGTTHLPDSGGSNPVVTNADAVIGTGDGTKTQFQLVKDYTSGPVTRTRNLQKIVASTTLVAVNAVGQTEGTDFTVNLTTGVVTFTTAPASTLQVTAGCEFDVEVRFGNETNLSISIDGFAIRSTSIVLFEVRDQLPSPEEAFNGWSKLHGTVSASFSITLAEGRVHTFSPDASTYDLILPPVADVEPGGPIFFLVNESGSFTIDVVLSDLSALATLSVSSTAELLLTDDGAGSRTWIFVELN